ncbi:WD40 repeat domain-containing protein [Aphanothece hegewaldii CCALA 016]|uniref:WD40 repeat domain-containing protein n=1 Tax=Aphanothece hegewaldii CCALA 016 TaxID=2107694 RepID=A0A2T1LWB0_9CHRO|nr:WD40 repeat domain-containing protein [Aphanothece hegewaldii]PSF36176.1 WD40 repeat domain-containing protein [Aphanothece hegewaldii CCALA 016]
MRFIDSTHKNALMLTGIASLLIIFGNHHIVKAQLPPSPPKPEPQYSPTNEQPKEILQTNPEQWQSVDLVRIVGNQEGTINTLLFSPDNRYIMGGGYRNQPNLKIWDLSNDRRQSNIRAQRRGIQALAINSTGETLVSGGEDGGINFWNWKNGDYIGIAVDHRTHIMDLAISPDGQILVSAALDGIKVWSLCDRRPLYTLTRIGEPAYALSMNPNGTTLASGDGEGKIKFWDIRQGVFLSEFVAHKEAITGIIYTPDGTRLITSSADRTVKVWDVQSQRLLYTFIGHSAQIRSIALHPNGEVLASASNDGVRLWDVVTGETLGWPEKCRDWVESVAFSPNGRYLATGGYDFQVRLWQPTALSPQTSPNNLQTKKY